MPKTNTTVTPPTQVTDPGVAAAFSMLGNFRAIAMKNKMHNGMPLTDAEKAEFPEVARGYKHHPKYDNYAR